MWDRPWTRCSHRMARVGDDQEVVRVEAAGMGVEFVELDATSRRLIEMIVRIKLAAG
jgi:hypothetical protein